MAASVTLELKIDPQTGERTIIVRYHSEPDATPMEHEEEHRDLVEKLIEGGLISAADAKTITVERESVELEPIEAERRDERRALEEGS